MQRDKSDKNLVYAGLICINENKCTAGRYANISRYKNNALESYT